MNSDLCVAIHGLVYLSHKGCMASSEELAENICTNSARVRKVMSKLKKASLVETREGHVGGYILSLNAEQISVDAVAEALETKFVDMNWRSGSHDKPCLISSGMADIMDNMIFDLNQCCSDRMKNVTIADIEGKIFSDKKGKNNCNKKEEHKL
ncbi:Rrf2 family protein [Hathewaya proteolytica DSM 3090]|uniref:Rrf2 family protein n=1 Tax=Hathewaya proteolytica DSM 3090 TaxID=1121331 RepID=A0A1M6SDI3_9CLOT|nr:Rrf2 family transcriptional regulator [Hathewaya proteolytica]SHK42709.1 Rrf2 family protein [Hathewaya proteolytica DSM 3090]